MYNPLYTLNKQGSVCFISHMEKKTLKLAVRNGNKEGSEDDL